MLPLPFSSKFITQLVMVTDAAWATAQAKSAVTARRRKRFIYFLQKNDLVEAIDTGSIEKAMAMIRSKYRDMSGLPATRQGFRAPPTDSLPDCRTSGKSTH